MTVPFALKSISLATTAASAAVILPKSNSAAIHSDFIHSPLCVLVDAAIIPACTAVRPYVRWIEAALRVSPIHITCKDRGAMPTNTCNHAARKRTNDQAPREKWRTRDVDQNKNQTRRLALRDHRTGGIRRPAALSAARGGESVDGRCLVERTVIACGAGRRQTAERKQGSVQCAG